ncbi:MAG: DUF2029 domain-containing protein [Deltaproteobacteria bacterium]|nr:DUF2029 domain-containing protein [Deltaproteobacteria bacterium]
MRIALPVLAGLALLRFGFELWRLLSEPGSFGSNDLFARYGETQRWFADDPVYTSRAHAGYPPASYVLLWPLLGWLPWTSARLLWAGLNTCVLALGMAFLVRQSGADKRQERVAFALALLAAYPLPITLGNGQLGILTVTATIAGILLLDRRGPPSWRRDGLATALFLFALIKPSLTAPFLLLVPLRTARLRPVVVLVLGYAALTALAMSYRSRPLLAELAALAEVSARVAARSGHAHLPLWLGALGLGAWHGLATLLVLLALGLWIERNRGAALWPVLGVTTIVARLASYHRVYDDSLVLLALVALCRLAKQAARSGRRDAVAETLFLLVWIPLLLPATWSTMALPWSLVHQGLAPAAWLATAVYLAERCRRERAPTPAGAGE